MLRTGERRQRLGDIVAGTVVWTRAEARSSPRRSRQLTRGRAPEAREAYVPSLGVEAEPHRAELPSQLFELDRDEEVAPEPVEDEGPRVEIVSSDEDPAPEPEPEPELPRAEADEPEPEDDGSAEREPELELRGPRPRARARLEPGRSPPPPSPTPTRSPSPTRSPRSSPAAETDSKLPRVSSPALEELADDVAATASRPSEQRRGAGGPRGRRRAGRGGSRGGVDHRQAGRDRSPMDLVMDQRRGRAGACGQGLPEPAADARRNR